MAHKGERNHTKEKLEKIAIDKIAVNEAIQEWMDRKWNSFQTKAGMWFIRLVLFLLFSLIVKFFLSLVAIGVITAKDFKP